VASVFMQLASRDCKCE